MTCADVDRRLSEGREELTNSPDLQTHLSHCDRCVRLLKSAQSIAALLQPKLKRVRPWPPLWASVAAAFALAALFAGMQILGAGTAGWTGLNIPQVLLLAVWAGAVILAAAVSLDSALRPAARAPVPSWLPVLLLTLGFPALSGVLFPAGTGDRFVPEGLECLLGGLMIAAFAGGITYGVAAYGYVTDWARTGMLIGGLGGAVALIALQISCPDHYFAHVAVWHGLASGVAVLTGWLAGRRFQRTG